MFFDYDVNDRSEAYAELTHVRNLSELNLAPVPVNGLFLTNLDNPLLMPANAAVFFG